MHKQIILFDIDKTMFDVNTLFNKNIWPAVEKDLKITRAELDKVSEEYQKTISKGTEFNPDNWLLVAKEKMGEKANKIEAYFNNVDFFVNALYPEVIPTLNELSKNYVLGIYSEGDDSWQKKKMELSGINNFFEQKYIIITPDKVSDEAMGLIPSDSVVIDDRSDVVLALKKLDGVYSIWINRLNKESLPNTKEVGTLTGVLPMLERIRRENPPQN